MLIPNNFTDLYGATMLPGLRALVDQGYKKRPPMYPQIFNVINSTRSIEQYSQVSGVNRFQQIGIGQAVRRDQPVQGFKSTFTHSRWGLSVPTTIDVVEDDEWNLINTMHEDLGWSCMETREIDAASVFNNGFTNSAAYYGPDSVPLFSASHPLYKIGGVQSNLMAAADLDVYSLQTGMTQMENMKRPSGEFIHIGKLNLVVTPANRFMAYVLTDSKDDPSTANRSVNPLGGGEDGLPTPKVWRYITSSNAWFLVAEPKQTGLVWFDRKKPYTKSWTDDETEVGIIAMRYKKSHGWNNYIGTLGNAGL